jgi:hypothetical protein
MAGWCASPVPAASEAPPARASCNPAGRSSVRNAVPVGYRPAATQPGISSRRMGTVNRVDAANNLIYLNDGSVVHVAPSAVSLNGGRQVAITDILPGAQVAIAVPGPAVDHDSLDDPQFSIAAGGEHRECAAPSDGRADRLAAGARDRGAVAVVDPIGMNGRAARSRGARPRTGSQTGDTRCSWAMRGEEALRRRRGGRGGRPRASPPTAACPRASRHVAPGRRPRR